MKVSVEVEGEGESNRKNLVEAKKHKKNKDLNPKVLHNLNGISTNLKRPMDRMRPLYSKCPFERGEATL